MSANHSVHSERQEPQELGQTDPLSLSIFTPQLFWTYPPVDGIKDYITEKDMEDITECYSGQALVKEELSKAELQAQGVHVYRPGKSLLCNVHMLATLKYKVRITVRVHCAFHLVCLRFSQRPVVSR